MVANVGRLHKTYLQQLSTDIGCSLEDMPGVMDDRDEWGESQAHPCKQLDMMMMIFLLQN